MIYILTQPPLEEINFVPIRERPFDFQRPFDIVGFRGRCVKRWSRTPADPGSIPGAGDKKTRD